MALLAWCRQFESCPLLIFVGCWQIASSSTLRKEPSRIRVAVCPGECDFVVRLPLPWRNRTGRHATVRCELGVIKNIYTMYRGRRIYPCENTLQTCNISLILCMRHGCSVRMRRLESHTMTLTYLTEDTNRNLRGQVTRTAHGFDIVCASWLCEIAFANLFVRHCLWLSAFDTVSNRSTACMICLLAALLTGN